MAPGFPPTTQHSPTPIPYYLPSSYIYHLPNPHGYPTDFPEPPRSAQVPTFSTWVDRRSIFLHSNPVHSFPLLLSAFPQRYASSLLMKVSASFVDGRKKRKEGRRVVGPSTAKKRPRGQLQQQQSSMAIQRLFDTCKAVFKGPGTVPLPLDVSSLRNLLNNMKAEDVGLSADLSFLDRSTPTVGGTPVITWTRVHHCDNFSVCIFVLPSAAVMPLHNHPGMTVFSKLLAGSMRIKAYDWAHPDEPEGSDSPNHPRLAELKLDDELSAPCDISILYPDTRNMHTFTAITPCIVLDVLGPPYADDRECTYYKEMPSSTPTDRGDGRRFCLLERMEMNPEVLQFVKYRGPQIIDG